MVEWKLSAASKGSPFVQVSDGGINVAQLAHVINTSSRPFVLINERELSVLRRGLTKDGWKRILYLQPADLHHGTCVGAGLFSTANQWLEKDIRIPEPGGDANNFKCECGVGLEIPEDFEIKRQYACPVCLREYSGDEHDDALRNMQHMRLAGAALSLALVYTIGKDRIYSDKAAEILLSYTQYYQRLGSTAAIVRNSIDEAAWAIAMAQAYDLIYYSRSLNEEERGAIERLLLKPLAYGFRNFEYDGVPGAWCISATGVIGLCIKDARLASAALNSFGKWMSAHITDGGLCSGPANVQHFSAVSALLHLAEAFYRAGIDIFSTGTATQSFKAMFITPLNLMYPSFRFPTVGDGDYDSFLPLDLYEVAYRRWGDPELAWALKKGYKFGETPVNLYQRQHPEKFSRSGFYAFLFGRDLPGRSAVPAFRSMDYPSLGMCSLRSGDNLMVTVDYHAFDWNYHLGRLGFTLFAGDDVVIPDYGSSRFGGEAAGWSRGTAAHNTIMVDGKPQSRSCESGLVTQCAGTSIQSIECRSNNCVPGVNHSRKIMILDRICAIHDVMTSDEVHEYDWLMRCEGIPEIKDDCESLEIEPSNTSMLEWEKAYKVNNSCRVDWKLASSDLVLAMWHLDDGGEFALGNCVSNIADRRVPIIRTRQRGKEVGFLAVLVPSQACEGVVLKRDGCVITLINQDSSIDNLFLRGCGTCAESVLETDAEFAAVRTYQGEIRSIVISKGSWLKWDGKSMLECSSKVGCLELAFEERGPQMKYRGEASGMVKVRTNARALRVNGFRAPAYNTDGYATLRIAGHMIEEGLIPDKN